MISDVVYFGPRAYFATVSKRFPHTRSITTYLYSLCMKAVCTTFGCCAAAADAIGCSLLPLSIGSCWGSFVGVISLTSSSPSTAPKVVVGSLFKSIESMAFSVCRWSLLPEDRMGKLLPELKPIESLGRLLPFDKSVEEAIDNTAMHL